MIWKPEGKAGAAASNPATARDNQNRRARRGLVTVPPAQKRLPIRETKSGVDLAYSCRPFPALNFPAEPPCRLYRLRPMSRESERPTQNGKKSPGSDKPLKAGTLLGDRYRIDRVLGF